MVRAAKSLKILVTDDYASMRKRLTDILIGLGHSVEEAANGVEALEMLEKQDFDLLVSDIVMPEMDGFELCEEVRKSARHNQLPIIVVSTHYDSSYIVKALRWGADDFVPKPFDRELIADAITRTMAQLKLEK